MREANLRRGAGAGLRRFTGVVALGLCIALAGVGQASADSGETGASGDVFTDVTAITAADCNIIRNQIASGFGGDWIFICYRDEEDNPACGLFSTASDQTNVLGYCQDRFPNGISPRLGPVVKGGVRILGTTIGTTTGLVGFIGETEVRSNVVCATYNPAGTVAGGRQICVQIDTNPSVVGSDTTCPASDPLFRISAPNASACTTLASIVSAETGQTISSADVAFGWMTDVGPSPPATPVPTVGRPGSEGLLLCAEQKATCLSSELPVGFDSVQIKYQLPSGTIQENPDCRTFRGVRYC